MAARTQLQTIATPGQRYASFASKASVAYTTFGFPILWTDAEQTASTAAYLEVYVKATAGTVLARLYDLTDADGVTLSEISSASAVPVRLRNPVSFHTSLENNHEYVAQFGKAGADAGVAYGARMVVEH